MTGSGVVPVAVLAGVGVAGLVWLLVRLKRRQASDARRLAADVAVVVDANPSHRLDPAAAGPLGPLAEAVNRLAEERESAVRDAAERSLSARRGTESERNRFAALMAQLTVAVVACNSEGRILLYNDAAMRLLGDTMPLGLGRSVFGVVDRGLVAHAQERLASGPEPVYTATSLLGDKLLRVRVTPVREREAEAGPVSGFVLVLEDLTREIRSGDQRERVLRRLTEATRGSLGSIRAAAESMLDFPELTAAERRQFLEIVRDESDQLGRRLDDLAVTTAPHGEDRGVDDVAGDDLIAVLRLALDRAGLRSAEPAAGGQLWLRADPHAVGRVVAHLAGRLAATTGADAFALDVAQAGPHGQVDVRWQGSPVAGALLDDWLDEPLQEGSGTSGRDVVDRHRGELWCGGREDGTSYLRLLLPLAEAGARPTGPAPVAGPPSRPEFYDFDLFATPTATELFDRPLAELSFTVLDTETTGLDPRGGDRVIAIGAVRVVNGRVLRQETFEQLVRPGRPVPPESTAIHGITDEMLEDAPAMEEVLPSFARFAEDTVLVGHNVGFDLEFLRLAADGPVRALSQPALDTLLLDAAVHPDHPDHTLEAIAARMGVSVVGRHTALGDALVTAEVFVGLATLLRGRGIGTLAEALAVARTTYRSRVDESLHGG